MLVSVVFLQNYEKSGLFRLKSSITLRSVIIRKWNLSKRSFLIHKVDHKRVDTFVLEGSLYPLLIQVEIPLHQNHNNSELESAKNLNTCFYKHNVYEHTKTWIFLKNKHIKNILLCLLLRCVSGKVSVFRFL